MRPFSSCLKKLIFTDDLDPAGRVQVDVWPRDPDGVEPGVLLLEVPDGEAADAAALEGLEPGRGVDLPPVLLPPRLEAGHGQQVALELPDRAGVRCHVRQTREDLRYHVAGGQSRRRP